MKIVVTGAAGRLGSVVCGTLSDRGYTVVPTDVGARRDIGMELRLADLLDKDACCEFMRGADMVVHLGNHATNVGRPATKVYLENVTMNFHVFHAAVEAGVRRIVFASSVQVCAGDRRDSAVPSPIRYLPADGELPPIPGNAYALSKHAGEQMLEYFVRCHSISGVAIRFPLLIEPHMRIPWPDYQRLDEQFACLAFEDAARLVAAVCAADLPSFRVYFPAAPNALNGLGPLENVRQYYANVALRTPLESMRSLVDVSRITEETGWVPQHLFAAPSGCGSATR